LYAHIAIVTVALTEYLISSEDQWSTECKGVFSNFPAQDEYPENLMKLIRGGCMCIFCKLSQEIENFNL